MVRGKMHQALLQDLKGLAVALDCPFTVPQSRFYFAQGVTHLNP